MAFIAKGNYYQSAQRQIYQKPTFPITKIAVYQDARRTAQNELMTQLARKPGITSPLDADTGPTTRAKQTLSAAHLALNERGDPLPKIKGKGQNAPAADAAFIGFRQQIVPIERGRRNEAARYRKVVVN